MDPDFWLFAAVGFAAKLVDGATSAAFLGALVSGHWETAGLRDLAWSLAGLIGGGVVAAPIAGWATKVLPLAPADLARRLRRGGARHLAGDAAAALSCGLSGDSVCSSPPPPS